MFSVEDIGATRSGKNYLLYYPSRYPKEAIRTLIHNIEISQSIDIASLFDNMAITPK